MIYGMRPFGEGQTQSAILNQGTMLRAKSVEFPAKPTVSDEAKDFLRKCLTHNQVGCSNLYYLSVFVYSSILNQARLHPPPHRQVERPDVTALCSHPYIRPVKGGGRGGSNS